MLFLQTMYESIFTEITDQLWSVYFVWPLTVPVYELEQPFSLAEELITCLIFFHKSVRAIDADIKVEIESH